MNEVELSKKICDYLNKSSALGYHFKFINSFCDIADEKNKIYIEVKPDHLASAQILHAIAREGTTQALMCARRTRSISGSSANNSRKLMASRQSRATR